MAATCTCDDNDPGGTYAIWCDKCKGLKMLNPMPATLSFKKWDR